jgi:hypothetical protein
MYYFPAFSVSRFREKPTFSGKILRTRTSIVIRRFPHLVNFSRAKKSQNIHIVHKNYDIRPKL